MIRILASLLIASSLLASSHVFASELQAGGGEPGAALLRHFEAIRSGDANRISGGMHPDQRAKVGKDLDRAIVMLQALMPNNVHINGGSVHGDIAKVLFTGNIGSYVSKNSAQMVLVNGRWMANAINFNCGKKGC
jgi:hypothetical protein